MLADEQRFLELFNTLSSLEGLPEPADPAIDLEDLITDLLLDIDGLEIRLEAADCEESEALLNILSRKVAHSNDKYFRQCRLLTSAASGSAKPYEVLDDFENDVYDLVGQTDEQCDPRLTDLATEKITCPATLEVFFKKIEGDFDRRSTFRECAKKHGIFPHKVYRNYQKFLNENHKAISEIVTGGK